MTQSKKTVLFPGLLTCIPLLAVLILTNCAASTDAPPLFELVPHEQTGINFINNVEEGVGSNILETEFFYNGGGVATGDINNDGLTDIYFTANTGENALYLNQGNFQFKNITAKAMVGDASGWSAGTAMVDINGDGFLDIYVCKAGETTLKNRHNKLFINNGDMTFTEAAESYGLDDPGYCTQPAFLDYDRDGDLDLYIVNYSVKPLTGFDLDDIRTQVDRYAGDRLYRNDNGTFRDVSREAGIEQNPIGFGLSATVSDLNRDGWPDIFVTNDFIERDYLYINQGDGTFEDEIFSRTDLTSYFSMGSDIADINNDASPDILVADMLPYEYARRRVFKKPDYSMYEQLTAHGYHRQNMRNTLQINSGNGTFTEVGRLAGISNTDWSWAPLLADFNNDGRKDIVVTNGFGRFYTDLDYLNNILWEKYPHEELPEDPKLLYKLVQQMKPVELHNFAFKNEGNLSFRDVSETWGVNQQGLSTGAAYADLDNDGALDYIVNNINEPPFILRNRTRTRKENNYLKIRLQGAGMNTYGIGAKITVTGKDSTIFFQENFPVRGFQSSVDPVLHFGLGSHQQVDIEVIWPDQSHQKITDVSANQLVRLHQNRAGKPSSVHKDSMSQQNQMFLFLDNAAMGMDFTHQESIQRDRIDTPLMPHTLTNLGPALASGDVNNDKLADLFVGGGQGQTAALYLQQPNGTFNEVPITAFEEHRQQEDTDALFMDITGNGSLDLYVVSGGNSDPANGPGYQDRLYINDGFGNFAYAPDALPRMHSSGGTVTPVELNGDGAPDLFVGGRVNSGRYPSAPRSYLLKNNNGQFRDITQQAAPQLASPGMVTDAVWGDFNSNGRPELVIAGEWMPIRIFEKNNDHTFHEITKAAGLQTSAGWWNVLKAADLNSDGHLDLIAGNRGLNAFWDASTKSPAIVYAGDFNHNGYYDPILTQVIEENRYPVPGRDLLLRQLPELEKKFPTYASYSTATIEDILTDEQMEDAIKLEAHTFASTVFQNKGDGTFRSIPLPRQAQTAPIFDMVVSDFDHDSIPDLLVAGSNFGTRPENGPTANEGMLLKGQGTFDFSPISSHATGFLGVGDVRNIEVLSSGIGPLIIVGRHGDTLIPYLYQGPQGQ
ncbi:VCBS repeat-containing protein [Fodinibius sediminis]|uniref:Repeat domain-containing protein n=1 Tax=Fodinibius sediminis TaxID=1214077 RepID=A0A521DI70_9BACT|nr:VCBS repeat-containing protein [Fodinibius sediminis]SMO71285.1 Repeat domain-containing protein [Fodinibius sediminis]